MITRREWLTTPRHSPRPSAAPARPRWMHSGAARPGRAPILRTIPSSSEKLPVIGLGTNHYSPTTLEERLARRVVLERLPHSAAAWSTPRRPIGSPKRCSAS